MLNVIGVGLVSPGVALGVFEGVIVTWQLCPANMVPQPVHTIEVMLADPDVGHATLFAVTFPLLSIVMTLGFPTSAAFNEGLLTDSPSVDTLAESVVSLTLMFQTFDGLGL